MVLLNTALALLFLAYVAKKFYVAFFKPGVSDVPGHLLSKFTDLHSVYKAYTGQRGSWIKELHRQHGNLVRLGPNRFSLADPAGVELLYATKTEFPKSDQMTVLDNAVDGKVTEGMVGTANKKIHGAIRAPVSSIYSMSSITRYEPLIDDTIRLFIERLAEEFVRPNKPCDIDHWVQYFAFDAITALTTSHRLGFLKMGGDKNNMIGELNKDFRYKGLVMHAPWLEWYLRKNPIYLRLGQSTSFMARTTRAMVFDRLGGGSKTGSDVKDKPDMLSRFIELHKEKPKEITILRLIRYTSTNLLTGSDTTAISFRSIIYRCLKSPQRTVFKGVQAEIDAANLEFPPAYNSVSTLPYLDAVIKEAMRMLPIFPTILEREVTAGGLTLPDGRTLPAGSIVGSSGITVHFDKSVHGPDADVFNPDRWLQAPTESHEQYTERLHKMRAADMTWGRGSRTCLGKNVAIQELYKTTATLFGVFDMELVDPGRDWTVTQGFMQHQSDMDIYIRWRANMGLESISPASAD